jgi:hypothetical protein
MTVTPFTGLPEDMYARDDEDDQNNRDFITCAYENNILPQIYWPNKAAAPWYLQIDLNGAKINFWPHKLVAHVAYESHSAHGLDQMFATVRRIAESKIEDFDIVEDFQ